MLPGNNVGEVRRGINKIHDAQLWGCELDSLLYAIIDTSKICHCKVDREKSLKLLQLFRQIGDA